MIGKTKFCPYFQNTNLSSVHDLQKLSTKENKTKKTEEKATINMPCDEAFLSVKLN